MRFLFFVQGEGRGHMTQAISLSEMLRKSGHEVTKVLIGKSQQRDIPKFFYEKIGAPVDSYESPNFVTGSDHKKIMIGKTIIYNFLKIRTYVRSLKKIHAIVKEERPDVIVNFYELMTGLYHLVYHPKSKHICIGHQYLLLHPQFQFPIGWKIDNFLLRMNTRIVSQRAVRFLALSFRPMDDVESKKIFVVPPLLRPEVLSLTNEDHGFILGYVLNAGYADEIIAWHKQNQHVKAHFFWDKRDAPEEYVAEENLVFHRLNDTLFLEMMSKCSGYSSTAGFESICEAMYLGKPIMMVPTENHYEQACNALDASISGAGFKNDTFDLSALVNYIPRHHDIRDQFRSWVKLSEVKFLDLLTRN